LQQGTGTNQTIGVPQVRPALVLPLQQGTVLNQTVLPLQQSTGTDPTIGVPQVRPMLVLPQRAVQNVHRARKINIGHDRQPEALRKKLAQRLRFRWRPPSSTMR